MVIVIPGNFGNVAVEEDGEDQLDRSLENEVLRTVKKKRNVIYKEEEEEEEMLTGFVTTYAGTVF